MRPTICGGQRCRLTGKTGRSDFSRLPDRAVKLARGTRRNQDGDVRCAPHEQVGGDGGPRRQIRRTLNDIGRAALALQEKLHLPGWEARHGERRRCRCKRKEGQRQGWKRTGKIRAGDGEIRRRNVLLRRPGIGLRRLILRDAVGLNRCGGPRHKIGQHDLRIEVRGHVLVDDEHREGAVGAMNGINGKQKRIAGAIEDGIAGPRKILEQFFARPGDSVLNGTSDSLLLSVYAVHRTNGALTMLVINKDMTTNLNAQIVLTNFVPWTTATIQSYGIPQDQAAQTNAGAAQQDITTTNFPIAGTNFTCSFPPLSLTLFTFAPAASALSVSGLPPGQVQLLLQGQRGTPYVIQSSPDLTAWTSVATNLLMGSTSNITILVSPGSPRQFYRAVWQP